MPRYELLSIRRTRGAVLVSEGRFETVGDAQASAEPLAKEHDEIREFIIKDRGGRARKHLKQILEIGKVTYGSRVEWKVSNG